MKKSELVSALRLLCDALDGGAPGRKGLHPDTKFDEHPAIVAICEPDGYTTRFEISEVDGKMVLVATRTRKTGLTQSTDPRAPFYEETDHG